MLSKKTAIVIPIHKIGFNHDEEISFRQAEKVFSKEDIILALPEHIYYSEEYKKYKKEKFSRDYFESVESYNRLMLSAEFYKRFIAYDYILIYQLDAFVFKNKLGYFTELDYDYIGAPWLHGIFYYINEKNCIWHVGNGGFSLRKVKPFIRILEEKEPLKKSIINEDVFFSSVVDGDFKTAPFDVALQFSFEKQVEKCFQLNKGHLPFGCHAWKRYDKKFWTPYIQQQGYMVREDEGGNEDDVNEKEYKWFGFFSDMWKKEETRNSVSRFFRKGKDGTDTEYILFGAGYVGRSLYKWMEINNIPIKGFADNKAGGDEEVIPPANLLSYKGQAVIIVSLLNYEKEIAAQLEEMGFEYRKDFYFLADIISSGYDMEG